MQGVPLLEQVPQGHAYGVEVVRVRGQNANRKILRDR
jgi:hypothetical protein